MKVIIADDHGMIRAVLAELFEELGSTVIEASTGEEAVSVYGDVRPDWVVMDIRMPGYGGLEATSRILKHDHRARIVVMSQEDGKEAVEAARDAGAAFFVAKDRLVEIPRLIIEAPIPQMV